MENPSMDGKLEQTKRETDRKCPACGGTMDFDPETGGLGCPFCGHREAIPQDAENPLSAVELDFASAETRENCDWGVEKKTVICKSCGAESVYDALQVADECPYCGSNQVMEEKGVHTLAPGGVCPFQVTEKNAGERFKRWIRGKLFCPKAAKQSARPEAFRGVYLPFWTFDSDTYSRYCAQYGKNRTVHDKDGKTHTVTDWYPASGTYTAFIDDQLVSGTERYNKGMLSGIEPFHTKNNVAYRPEYVAGFAAERYSVGLQAAWETAKAKIAERLKDEIADKVRAEHCASQAHVTGLNTQHGNVKYKYLLLPIWIASYRYNGKTFSFMVNGQTGKISGKTPVSAIRVIIAVLIVLAIIALIVWAFNR